MPKPNPLDIDTRYIKNLAFFVSNIITRSGLETGEQIMVLAKVRKLLAEREAGCSAEIPYAKIFW